jgi:hypothetical protein
MAPFSITGEPEAVEQLDAVAHVHLGVDPHDRLRHDFVEVYPFR